jgi:tRNA (guanine-N7-)-methyltransferase
MSRSVSKPDFQYARSFNIYWDKLNELPEELKGLAFADQKTEQHQGKWREQYKAKSNSNELLHVEIGCNAGHVSVEWARLAQTKDSTDRYIGIDWKFKMVYKFAEKIAKFKLENLLAFRANAERLQYMFAPKEIDFLYMFFPDPWPKKAQKKNRTANAEWLRTVAPLLSDRGYFHIKTDHEEYFDFILSELNEVKDIFEPFELTRNLHENHPNPKSLLIPDVTLFERLFIKDGLPIYSVKLKKKQ